MYCGASPLSDMLLVGIFYPLSPGLFFFFIGYILYYILYRRYGRAKVFNSDSLIYQFFSYRLWFGMDFKNFLPTFSSQTSIFFLKVLLF